MKEVIQTLLNFIGKEQNLSAEGKRYILKTLNELNNRITYSEHHIPEPKKEINSTVLLPEELLAALAEKNKMITNYAREAQIVSALEQMRAKALAMQTSHDLLKVANVLREQMGNLGQPELESSIVHIYNKEAEYFEAWYSFRPPNNTTGSLITGLAKIPKDSSEWAREVMANYKSYKTEYTIVSSGQKLLEWYKVLAVASPETVDYDENGNILIPEILYYHFSKFSGGSLLMILDQEPSVEARELQKRAALEFNLAYTRFLDLKKAEAQTRAAQIEVSLERIRTRALAMQEPEELVQVAQFLRQEMGLLGVEELEGSSIFIHEENTGKAACWYAINDTSQTEKRMVAEDYHLNLNDTWVGRKMLHFFNSDDVTLSISMIGEHRREWIEYSCELSPYLEMYFEGLISEGFYHLAKFSGGAIAAGSLANLSEESWDLLKRAASVFSLAYSRFKDLTQARSDLIRLKEEKQRSEKALAELKATQTQLIQAAKMASLGELTAGIAHEIQNPLNFVNNFSELNKELIQELKEELKAGKDHEVVAIAEVLEQNLEKINNHGQRADAIVKGMLQHARTSSGEKQPTNLNELVEEYLRLAYHGQRAKDKNFNASLATDLNSKIEKITVVPQDIGRVLLNIFNNAFYAVQQKQRQIFAGTSQYAYQPQVKVSTSKGEGLVIIRIWDNGTGISETLKSKIFHPFFTTKPAGQGTGLGLSLSYDIITKGHKGELELETKEGEFAEFIIRLPV